MPDEGARASIRAVTAEQELVVERVCGAIGVDDGLARLRDALVVAEATELPMDRTALLAFVGESLREVLRGEATPMLEALISDLQDFHEPGAALRSELPPSMPKAPPPSKRAGLMRVLVVRRDALTRAQMSQSLLSSGFDVESVIADDLESLAEPIDVYHAVIADLDVLDDLARFLPRGPNAPLVVVRTRGPVPEAKAKMKSLLLDELKVLSESASLGALVAMLKEAMHARGLRGR